MEVHRDAIEDFRPIRDYRAKMVSDIKIEAAAAVKAAVDRWDDLVGEMMFRPLVDWDEHTDSPAIHVPFGLDELTYLIAWWCDQSTYSIDPTPLTECLRHAIDAAAHYHINQGESASTAFGVFQSANLRCHAVLTRIRYAVTIAAGCDPEPPQQFFYPKQLEKELGCSDTKVRQLAKVAGVFDRDGTRYSLTAVINILNCAIDGGASDSQIIENARRFRALLKAETYPNFRNNPELV